MDDEKESEFFKQRNWAAYAKLAGCYKTSFAYPTDWDEFFKLKKLPEMLPVKASEIDRSMIYRPYIPLQVTNPFLNESPSISEDRFPHKCSSCGGPAYIGFMKTECKRGCQ